MNDMETLERKFGSDSVKFTRGPGGFVCIEVANAAAKAKISTYAAHLFDYTPAGERPVLWMSGSSWFEVGKPIRGGVPVCWPWFGPGAREELPAHGFARLSQWEVRAVESFENGSVTRVVLGLTPDQVAKPELVTFAFDLECEFLIGRSLTVALTMKNCSDAPVVVTDALHTYFAVKEAEAIRVRGLDQVGYEDRVVGAPVVLGHVQQGDIRIDREVDRIYHTTGAVEIFDPGFNRTIRVEKSGSAATVVWNPWIRKSHAMPDFGDEEYHSMICVEAANASVDARTLFPGEKRRISQTVTVL